MKKHGIVGALSVSAVAFVLLAASISPRPAFAQEATAAVTEEPAAPAPLSAEEMEILVARIALYPDELVAVIVSSSLYPLQIVQAARFLEDVKTKPHLKPDPNWDGSVVSLMNYPDIVKMMNDELNWTQTLGEAITNQQKDVLEAIQQLRDKAVAEGIIKSDDKVKIVQENDAIVIQPASAEVIYVPQYEPAMLYEQNYVPAPIYYYPDPYPNYYSPAAPYFAGFVTGAIWGSVVDWNDWGVWGGNGNWGDDINIDCNHCFNDNDFSGKVNINDVDWKNVDRNKMSFDNNQFKKVDQNSFNNSIKANDRNSIKTKSAGLKNTRSSSLPSGKGDQVKDVRKSTLEGLSNKPGDKAGKPAQGSGNKLNKPSQGAGDKLNKPAQGAANKVSKPSQGSPNKKPTGSGVDRPVGKPKPAARPDTRPKTPSPMGDVTRGRDAKAQSDRGVKSMGGGMNKGGGGAPKVKRSAGGGGGGGKRR